MLRDANRLQRHATLVAADLGRTLDGTWACTVTVERFLRVVGPAWEGLAELDADVNDDEWPADAGELPEQLLENDASLAVAEQVTELLGNAQVDWPRCPVHQARLEPAAGRWTCEADDHDVAAIGALPRGDEGG